ncbi:MAG: hypothetical protein ACOC3S_01345 [Bacteroidota bacterium]
MNAIINIQNGDPLRHFKEMLKFGIGQSKIQESTRIISEEQGITETKITIEHENPADLFELGRLFGSVKMDVQINDQVTKSPGSNGMPDSFKINLC